MIVHCPHEQPVLLSPQLQIDRTLDLYLEEVYWARFKRMTVSTSLKGQSPDVDCLNGALPQGAHRICDVNLMLQISSACTHRLS